MFQFQHNFWQPRTILGVYVPFKGKVVMDHQDSFQLQKHLNEHQVSEITGLSVKDPAKVQTRYVWAVLCKIGSSCCIPGIGFGELAQF